MDIIDILFDLPEKLGGLVETLQLFLFQSIDIGGYQISFWGLLGGFLITVLIIGGIIGAIK